MKQKDDSKKRIQLIYTDETWAIVDGVFKEANKDFQDGSVTVSDIINEFILTGKAEVKHLQAKHTNVKKTFKRFAAIDEMDIDSAIKALMEIKQRSSKVKSSNQKENLNG